MKMNSKALIVFLLIVIPLTVLLLFFSLPKQHSESYIASTTPKNGESGVAFNLPIVVAFNKEVTVKDIAVKLTPHVPATYGVFNNALFISPEPEFAKNTTYTVEITIKGGKPYTFIFTTGETVGGTAPDAESLLKQEEETRKARPDVYLTNKLPHSQNEFSMTSTFNQESKQFKFIVELLGNSETSKAAAINWMKSQKLTDAQIATLDITYQSTDLVTFKNKLPYDGLYFTINYERDPDRTNVIIYKSNREAGEREFDAFLKANGISSRDMINNLSIQYK